MIPTSCLLTQFIKIATDYQEGVGFGLQSCTADIVIIEASIQPVAGAEISVVFVGTCFCSVSFARSSLESTEDSRM